MGIGDWLIAPDAVAACGEGPLRIVDLASCPADATIESLPPFPLLGVGDPGHPLAARLDAVIEPPISGEAVLRQIVRTPLAAAILVGLLRGIESLSPSRALMFESLAYATLQGSAEHNAWLASRPAAVEVAAPGRLDVMRRDHVLHLRIDRPRARNAIDRALRDALFEAFTLAALDPDIATIRLCAGGAAFGIGADLAEFGTTRDPATAHLIRMRTLPALPLLHCAERLEVRVQGACIGASLEVAAFARRIAASRDAWFQLPELAMGVIPGAGGCVSVSRRIGRQRAALMILSGRRIDARTALRWRLVDAIEDAPPGDEGGADEI